MSHPEQKLNPYYLLNQWELQQNAHIKRREERFNAMFDVVSGMVSGNFRALDLACGPGSISRRLLERFSSAASVAIDYDPVLLHIGKSALGDVNGRLTWVEANLREEGWQERLPEGKFDVIMSTTALHWIPHKDLKNLYSELHKILSPGGIFMNGDHMKRMDEDPKIASLMHKLWKESEEKEFVSGEIKDWKAWWSELDHYPELKDLLEERGRRYSNPDEHNNEIYLDEHEQYLSEAGFERIGVVWQDLESRVLLAVKE